MSTQRPKFEHLSPEDGAPVLQFYAADGSCKRVELFETLAPAFDRRQSARFIDKATLIEKHYVSLRLWRNGKNVFIQAVGNFVVPARDGGWRWVHGLRWKFDGKTETWSDARVPMVPADKSRQKWVQEFTREDAMVKCPGFTVAMMIREGTDKAKTTLCKPFSLLSLERGTFATQGDDTKCRPIAMYFNPPSLMPKMAEAVEGQAPELSDQGNRRRWEIDLPAYQVPRVVQGTALEPDDVPGKRGKYSLFRLFGKDGAPMFKVLGPVMPNLMKLDPKQERQVVLGAAYNAKKEDGTYRPEEEWTWDVWYPGPKQLRELEQASIGSNAEVDLSSARLADETDEASAHSQETETVSIAEAADSANEALEAVGATT